MKRIFNTRDVQSLKNQAKSLSLEELRNSIKGRKKQR